jgi:hypothetical protein
VELLPEAKPKFILANRMNIHIKGTMERIEDVPKSEDTSRNMFFIVLFFGKKM